MRLSTLAVCTGLATLGVLAPDVQADRPEPIDQDTITQPVDRPYPGEIRIAVDASDVSRRIMHVRETISGIGPETVLLYPKWLPGTHSPQGPVERLAGLEISTAGKRVAWVRDPLNPFAFRLAVPPGVQTLDLEFDYLSPTSPKTGRPHVTQDILVLDWNLVILYPAGYYVSRIPVDASVTLPEQWSFASALETASSDGTKTGFKRVSLETLVDSPLFAGRHTARLDLEPGAAAPVHLDLFADRPESLVVQPAQLETHRKLVQQAYKLFGSRHFAHYDFLFSLSDELPHYGLEHHQSSADFDDSKYFTDERSPVFKDLLPHEFVHSWNGKFRRPRDLWTPNLNVPMQDTLLWVYEGQTNYWGKVLATRCGLVPKQAALDDLATIAAFEQTAPGRKWRSLQDTTNEPIVANPTRSRSWQTWQRSFPFYSEGALIWLDADTLIRERSHGRRSLDDFARRFFGTEDGAVTVVTYTFDDVVKALNDVEPYEWAHFLRARLDAVDAPPPLDGLRRGGYRLVFNDTPSDYLKAAEKKFKRTDLMYSIGLTMDEKEGAVDNVLWGGPAFRASLTEGEKIVAVNGFAYSAEILKDAVKAATPQTPLELIIKNGDRYRIVHLDYSGGMRYPHLEREPGQPALLDDVLAARP